MDIEEAGEIAEEFLTSYTRREEFLEKGGEAPRLELQTVDVEGGSIEVVFAIDPSASAKDASLVALAGKALAALKKAHPKVAKFKISYELYSG